MLDPRILDLHSIAEKFTDFDFNGEPVLVTGATGIVGGYFVSALCMLKKMGANIGEITGVSKSGVPPEWMKSDEFNLIPGDASSYDFLSKLPNFQNIIHAAGYGQPGKFLSDPLATLKLNSTGTVSLLEKINKHEAGRFMFISSSEVYSGLSSPPFVEDQIGTTNTNHPRAAYIEAKRFGEAAVLSSTRDSKIQGTVMRLALAYGPGTNVGDERVLNQFIVRARTGTLELHDQGTAVRTYCYIADAVTLMLEAFRKGPSGIYNIGGESRVTIAGLAQQISEITGAELRFPKIEEPKIGAPEDVWVNTDKALRLKPLREYVTLQDGLRRTIDWQSQWLT